jgi:hypothetical protein
VKAQMNETSRELYRSANGDCWLLVRDSERDRVFVRHIPNAPSGGKTQDVEVTTFLCRVPQGPEHKALLRLIGSLVSGTDESPGSLIA